MVTQRSRWARGLPKIAILFAAFLVFSGAGDVGEPDALTRIRSMSREQRESLSSNLSRFDDLPSDDKAAIRLLDAKLAGLSPEIRNRYLMILRRYHTFFNSLPEDRRKLLKNEPNLSIKLDRLLQYMGEQREADAKAERSYADALQTSQLAPRRFHQTARQLILWFNLDQPEDAKDRDAFAKMADPAARLLFLSNYPHDKKPHLFKELRHEYGEFMTEGELASVGREILVQGPKIKEDVEKRIKDELEKKAKHPEAAKKKGNREETEKELRARMERIVKQERVRAWLNTNEKKFEADLIRKHSEMPVKPEDLARFEEALPAWAWDSIDMMPPESARIRLSALYRMVFPIGREMPVAKPAAKAKAESPKKPPTAPGGANPF